MKKIIPVVIFVLTLSLWQAAISQIYAADFDQPCHAIQVTSSDEQAFLPDPTCTPGVIDPTVTQENLSETICKSGYTKKIRPPTSYTNALKKKQILLYGYQNTDLKEYEEDHLISLELGGSPRDPKNLWPEPHASINEKDTIENTLHAQVCAGEKTLAQAQFDIAHNWYEVYVKEHPPSLTVVIKEKFSQLFAWMKRVFSK